MTGSLARRQRGRVVRAPYLKSGGRGLNYAVFLPSFELGGITKHLMTGPVGNSEVCFPSTSMFPSGSPLGTLSVSENKIHCFPWGQSSLLVHDGVEIREQN